MNQLGQLMLEELRRRNFAPGTMRAYVHGVEHFSRYFHLCGLHRASLVPVSFELLRRSTQQAPPSEAVPLSQPRSIWRCHSVVETCTSSKESPRLNCCSDLRRRISAVQHEPVLPISTLRR